MTRPYLDPRDHAFASGPAFERPESRKAAQALFDDPRDGDLLWDLFARWSGVVGASHLRLGLGARLIAEPGAKVTVGEHCVIRGVIRVEADATFTLSNDKRDWTLTVGASFASGSACTPQTFTLVY